MAGGMDTALDRGLQPGQQKPESAIRKSKPWNAGSQTLIRDTLSTLPRSVSSYQGDFKGDNAIPRDAQTSRPGNGPEMIHTGRQAQTGFCSIACLGL